MAGLPCANDQSIKSNGSDWVCADDRDMLGGLSCTGEQTVAWIGGGWNCGDPVPSGQDVLDMVLARDADNSGLNANFLQGKAAEDFADADHNHHPSWEFHAETAGSYSASHLIATVAAANASGGAAIVHVAPGRYELDGVTLSLADGVSLRGAGVDVTTIARLDNGGPVITVDEASVTAPAICRFSIAR